MRLPEPIRRLRARDFDPLMAVRLSLTVLGKSLTRLWGRHVMLYNGGVWFFVMLAIFRALAIAIGLYGVLADPAAMARQAAEIGIKWSFTPAVDINKAWRSGIVGTRSFGSDLEKIRAILIDLHNRPPRMSARIPRPSSSCTRSTIRPCRAICAMRTRPASG